MNNLTLAQIKESCKKRGGYNSPELNSILYLNHLGVTELCEMPEYRPKTIWLQGNGLIKLNHLMSSITCLYLQNNCIKEIHGLEELSQLKELNLSHNMLMNLQGYIPITVETLYLSHNCISSSKELGNLKNIQLTTLDISHNHIGDELIIENTNNMGLKVFNMEGNPGLKRVMALRKRCVVKFTQLTYLNQSPVDESERRTSIAYFRGGITAERAERQAIIQENRTKERNLIKSTLYSCSLSYAYSGSISKSTMDSRSSTDV